MRVDLQVFQDEIEQLQTNWAHSRIIIEEVVGQIADESLLVIKAKPEESQNRTYEICHGVDL